MSTNNGFQPEEGVAPDRGGAPGPFSEEEIAEVSERAGDAELEDVEPANIEEREAEAETPLEKLAQKSRKLSEDRVRAVVESLLFVASKPLSLDQIFEATGIERPRLCAALEQLAGARREGVNGIVLQEVAGGWQLRTDPDSAEYVRRFLRVKPQRLTRAAVETLAIIAYRQPVTRPEVEDIRGVDSGAVVKALLERKLIKILGKKDEVGRPILYGTTREFLEFFALKDLASLPTLREFQELSQEHQEIVEKETAPPAPEGTVAELADSSFRERLDETGKDSEAALAELEQAISAADERSKAAASLLAKPAESAEDEPAGPEK